MALERLRYILALVAFLAAAFTQPRGGCPRLAVPGRRSLASQPGYLWRCAHQWGDSRPARVYVPGILANGVVQQPAGDPAFISSKRDLLTQFQQASQLGSTGVLAHNFLAGAQFSEIKPGQVIYLIYGDGRTAVFVVRDALSLSGPATDERLQCFR